MEEVLEKLSNTAVSEDGASSYDTLFKNRGRQGSQDERRRWILETQKRQREEYMDASRGILQLVEDVEMEWNSADEYKACYRPRAYVAGFHRTHSYRRALMLSEWMVDRPLDLEDWLITPCPKGTRVLLVAHRGRTKTYTKRGQLVMEGRSMLPGGEPGGTHATTVLDCVWQESRRTMHVLDLLAWNNQPMTDCDTEFRHFFLTGKVQEAPNLKQITKRNNYIFTLLPKTLCTKQNLDEVMQRVPMLEGSELDGLLLYHKRAHYTPGETPLVGWLYPYMLTEVLHPDITVAEVYKALPPDYTTQADFIRRFEEKHAHARARGKRHSHSQASMDTDCSGVSVKTEAESQTNGGSGADGTKTERDGEMDGTESERNEATECTKSKRDKDMEVTQNERDKETESTKNELDGEMESIVRSILDADTPAT